MNKIFTDEIVQAIHEAFLRESISGKNYTVVLEDLVLTNEFSSFVQQAKTDTDNIWIERGVDFLPRIGEEFYETLVKKSYFNNYSSKKRHILRDIIFSLALVYSGEWSLQEAVDDITTIDDSQVLAVPVTKEVYRKIHRLAMKGWLDVSKGAEKSHVVIMADASLTKKQLSALTKDGMQDLFFDDESNTKPRSFFEHIKQFNVGEDLKAKKAEPDTYAYLDGRIAKEIEGVSEDAVKKNRNELRKRIKKVND